MPGVNLGKAVPEQTTLVSQLKLTKDFELAEAQRKRGGFLSMNLLKVSLNFFISSVD